MGVLHATLRPLALRCVESADLHGRTPVIAIERGLTMSPEFYAALTAELRSVARRAVRLEILVDLERRFSLWRARASQRHANGIRAVLTPQFGDSAVVEARTVLSRPAGPSRPLVVGFAGIDDPVPQWASVLRLTCRPATVDDFQLIPAAA